MLVLPPVAVSPPAIAKNLGTPVVAYQPDPEELEILYSECPWLPADRHPARDVGQLVESLLVRWGLHDGRA
jgi:hypothetical protein